MSASAITKRNVVGIIPVEIQELYNQGKLDINKMIDSIVQEEKGVEIKQLSSKSTKEDAVSKKEEKRQSKIRDKMVQNIFGVKAKDIISFEKDYDDYKSGKTGHVKSQVDRAKALRGVWKVQEGQNKRSKKAVLFAVLGILASGLKSLIPGLGVISSILDISAIASFIACGKVAKDWFIFGKGRLGNSADSDEKQRAYIENVENLLNDIHKLTDSIGNDQQLIDEKQKTLSKKEFKSWMKEYCNQKIGELGLDPNKEQREKEEYQAGKLQA